jgi:hypothetical protein
MTAIEKNGKAVPDIDTFNYSAAAVHLPSGASVSL